jgi:hypothetical protein
MGQRGTADGEVVGLRAAAGEHGLVGWALLSAAAFVRATARASAGAVA